MSKLNTASSGYKGLTSLCSKGNNLRSPLNPENLNFVNIATIDNLVKENLKIVSKDKQENPKKMFDNTLSKKYVNLMKKSSQI